MKVKNCARVLSKSVSAALSYTSAFPLYPDGKPVSKTMKNTAAAVSFIDDLFDSVNRASTSGKFLRKAVTAKSVHHKFWDEAIKTLEGRWGSGQHMLTRVCNSGLTSEMQQPTLEPRGPAQSALYDDTACNTWRGI
ncbi:unnamed protein product [Plutella xylostella]|uniref:(diamondback moth) hypothetical protein n=1 Tax=Plutella xylostella TaxID=51655 RepID=A0A8S4GHW2_PLUXY|nr:unnamed protein product [Plutella xylostella]